MSNSSKKTKKGDLDHIQPRAYELTSWTEKNKLGPSCTEPKIQQYQNIYSWAVNKAEFRITKDTTKESTSRLVPIEKVTIENDYRGQTPEDVLP